MRPEYRHLRIKQLSQSLAGFEGARRTIRPHRGWLRAIRQALGLSLDEVASNLETNRQSVLKFEKAEAMDRITLRSLKRVAEAMSCELVYAIVPKKGSIVDLAQNDGISKRTRDEITNRVHSVEHTMALEDQATGNAEQAIADETKRILRKRQRT